MFISLVDTQKMPSLANSVLKAYSPSSELIRIPFYQDGDTSLGYELYVDDEGLISDSTGQTVSGSVGVLSEAMVRVKDPDTGVTKRTFFVRSTSSETMIVNYSYEQADKTYSEIVSAIQSGITVILKASQYGGVSFLSLTGNNSSGVRFSSSYPETDYVILREVTVSPSDVWSDTANIVTSEAPSDSKLYARKNGGWTEVLQNVEAFVVTFDDTTGGDKSYSQILGAINSGKVVIAKRSRVGGVDFYLLNYTGSAGISFNKVYNSNSMTIEDTINVTAENVWTRSTKTLDVVETPKVLAEVFSFKGTTPEEVAFLRNNARGGMEIPNGVRFSNSTMNVGTGNIVSYSKRMFYPFVPASATITSVNLNTDTSGTFVTSNYVVGDVVVMANTGAGVVNVRYSGKDGDVAILNQWEACMFVKAASGAWCRMSPS